MSRPSTTASDDPLDPIDEANAYRRIMDEQGLSQSALARLAGIQQVTISVRLMLLRLPPPDQERVRDGSLTLDAARKLANPDPRPRRHRERPIVTDESEPNSITFAVTDKEWAECVRRCKARNFTPTAFARAAFQKALRDQ